MRIARREEAVRGGAQGNTIDRLWADATGLGSAQGPLAICWLKREIAPLPSTVHFLGLLEAVPWPNGASRKRRARFAEPNP